MSAPHTGVCVATAPDGRQTLTIDGDLWMSDTAVEQDAMQAALAAAHGRVLVGGLGLGIFSRRVASMPRVTEVVTVEIDERVIEAIGDVDVVHADLFALLRDLPADQFDFAYLDIWRDERERCFREHIVPLRRLCRGKIADVQCWAEDRVLATVRTSLTVTADSHDDLLVGHYAQVFRPAWQTSGLPFADAVELYLAPGSDAWERHFGPLWDAMEARA